LELSAKEDLEYHQVAIAWFSPESLTTAVQSGHWLVAQGARMVGILLGPPEMLWKYCQRRNQVTLREVEELGFLFYFTPVVSDDLVLKILGPCSEITGFLKGSAEDQVTGNVQVTNRWAHTGVKDLRLFR
jgi:hypothetical protein